MTSGAWGSYDAHDRQDDPGVEPYFRAWSDRFELPSMMVTVSGRVVWANQAAEAFNDDIDDLSIDDGLLQFAERRTAASFRDFCAGLDEEPAAWLFRPRAAEQAYLFRAEALTPGNAEPAVALVVYPTSGASYLWADLKEVFGLTPAEERVVKHLTEGENVEEAAAALSISVETARTHVRRVYAKLGCSGREQMFARILAFRVR